MQEVAQALCNRRRVYELFRRAQDAALEAQLRIRHEQEVARVRDQVQHADLDRLRAVRRKIIDEILAQHCPRCKAAFVDWDGCIALTCAHCRAAFWGIFLQDCGEDAHRHCARCCWVCRSGLFPDQSDMRAASRAWRYAKIQRAVAELKPQQGVRLFRDMHADLQGVGLQ